VGTALNNLARLYGDQGRYAEAEPLYRRSLAIRETALGPDHPDVGTALNNVAWLALVQGDWARAADYWRRSTGVIQRRAERGLTGAAEGSSKREAQRFSWQFAGLVKTTQRLAMQGRLAMDAQVAKMFETAQWAQGSEAAASLAQMAARSAKGSPELGLLVRERQDLVGEWQVKDKQLIAIKSEEPAKRKAAAEKALSDRLAAIDMRLTEINAQFAKNFPDYAALASPAPMSVAEVQAQLGADEALVLFFDTVRFEPLPEETFIWVVTKTRVRWVRSELGTEMLKIRVATLRCGLDEEEWAGTTKAAQCSQHVGRADALDNNEPLPFHLGVAPELYRSLFGPVENLIRGKHLLIVPSGPLTSLPFHVLVTERPEKALPATFEAYRKAAWLVRSHAITVLPSVASLKALRAQSAKRQRAPDDYVGIGNPVLMGNGENCRTSKVPDSCPAAAIAGARQWTTIPSTGRATIRGAHGRRNAGKNLAQVYAEGADPAVLIKQVLSLCPLPDTGYELDCVGKGFPDHRRALHLGADASEGVIKKLSASGTLARYRIVHFATHGLLAGDVEELAKRQGEPALVLTPPERPADANDDGLLTASEVAQLRLNADWVVLSACSTAAGDGAGAEALSGLARAFFYAGTRALLVSHWPVYSDAAVRLTTRAFAELEHNPRAGRAQAFRRAMLDLIEDPSLASNAHPAVWAPFVVVGEGSADESQPAIRPPAVVAKQPPRRPVAAKATHR